MYINEHNTMARLTFITYFLLSSILLVTIGCNDNVTKEQVISDIQFRIDSMRLYSVIDTTIIIGENKLDIIMTKHYVTGRDTTIMAGEAPVTYTESIGELTLLKNGQLLHKATFDKNISGQAFNRPDIDESPFGTFNFNKLQNEILKFNVLLVEYDKNQMHFFDYSVSMLGEATMSEVKEWK
jgi:hypothetical protein